MRILWLFVLVSSTVLLTGAGAPPKKNELPPGKARKAEPPAPQGAAASRLTVRCAEDCTVKVEGRTGVRRNNREWEFEEVEPGKRRVDVTGKLLIMDRPLYGGYVDVPAGVQAVVMLDSRGRLTLSDPEPLKAQSARAKPKGSSSVLNVRCAKPCTVTLDRVRRGASSTHGIVVSDLEPGSHDVEVRFSLGTQVSRGSVEVPAASEVFLYASEGNLRVTNTTPLEK